MLDMLIRLFCSPHKPWVLILALLLSLDPSSFLPSATREKLRRNTARSCRSTILAHDHHNTTTPYRCLANQCRNCRFPAVRPSTARTRLFSVSALFDIDIDINIDNNRVDAGTRRNAQPEYASMTRIYHRASIRVPNKPKLNHQRFNSLVSLQTTRYS